MRYTIFQALKAICHLKRNFFCKKFAEGNYARKSSRAQNVARIAGLLEILNFADEKEIGEKKEDNSDTDKLYNEALEIIKSERKASTSFLQRKFTTFIENFNSLI